MTSLTASILDYRTFHGRTYQRSPSTTYWGPNDEQQMEGLDLTYVDVISGRHCRNLATNLPCRHHWMMLLLDDKLYEAPVGCNPQVGWLLFSVPLQGINKPNPMARKSLM